MEDDSQPKHLRTVIPHRTGCLALPWTGKSNPDQSFFNAHVVQVGTFGMVRNSVFFVKENWEKDGLAGLLRLRVTAPAPRAGGLSCVVMEDLVLVKCTPAG